MGLFSYYLSKGLGVAILVLLGYNMIKIFKLRKKDMSNIEINNLYINTFMYMLVCGILVIFTLF